MTSINTNIAATTALRTLQSTNMQLDATQSRISTGLKIGEAKDNAAYWSISTTLRSDNKALGTVKDALALGSATVDTAYQGLNASLDVLNEIKSKIVAASQNGVDKDAVGQEIAALQAQLVSIAKSSSFSGENLLSTNNAGAVEAQVVSGFTRTGDAITIDTIKIALDGLSLFNAGSGEGVLDKVQTGTVVGQKLDATTFATATFAAADSFTFTVKVGTGPAVQVTVNQALVKEALQIGSGEAIIGTADALATVLNAAFTKASVTGVNAQVVGGQVDFLSDRVFTIGGATNANTASTAPTALAAGAIGLTNTSQTAAGSPTDVSIAASAITVSKSTTTVDLKAYAEVIEKAIQGVTDAAAKLGAVSQRIELQQSFVNNLMDTIDAGISGLVDADMNEESTRLQALQVKQQLGVQALSIANQSAQNVLSLFR